MSCTHLHTHVAKDRHNKMVDCGVVVRAVVLEVQWRWRSCFSAGVGSASLGASCRAPRSENKAVGSSSCLKRTQLDWGDKLLAKALLSFHCETPSRAAALSRPQHT